METNTNSNRKNSIHQQILSLSAFAAIIIFESLILGCRNDIPNFNIATYVAINDSIPDESAREAPANYSFPLDRLIDSLEVSSAELSILVDKSKFILSVLWDTLTLKEYPVVLGLNPTDDKLCQGDNCTPEGNYKILAKYHHNLWSRFIWIDYPNEESLKKFRDAKENGTIPPESTPGGEIGIHGVPSGGNYIVDQGENWTAGCISLKNRDIDEIYNYVDVGTEVIIRK